MAKEKKEVKITPKICKRCMGNINLEKQKYVLIGTYDKRKKMADEGFYHWICFVEWYENQVKTKAENIVKDLQGKALKMVGGIMKNIGGGQY